MRNGHTPGPWLLDGRTVYALNDEGSNRFSALVQDAHTPAAELSSNARLIAAAPELLEALEVARQELMDMKEQIGFRLGTLEALEKCAAVIAKARGE